MSFKEKVIDYCKNTINMDCDKCVIKDVCCNFPTLPLCWNDSRFDLFKQELAKYQVELALELAIVEDLLKEN